MKKKNKRERKKCITSHKKKSIFLHITYNYCKKNLTFYYGRENPKKEINKKKLKIYKI